VVLSAGSDVPVAASGRAEVADWGRPDRVDFVASALPTVSGSVPEGGVGGGRSLARPIVQRAGPRSASLATTLHVSPLEPTAPPAAFSQAADWRVLRPTSARFEGRDGRHSGVRPDSWDASRQPERMSEILVGDPGQLAGRLVVRRMLEYGPAAGGSSDTLPSGPTELVTPSPVQPVPSAEPRQTDDVQPVGLGHSGRSGRDQTIDLESLADQVYELIRQRLTRERERRGI
jgi:hypothetical protein